MSKGLKGSPKSLGELYPKEQKRLIELIEVYKSIGPAGSFGLVAIKSVLDRANKASISGDVVEMIRSYEEMKGCE
jgi:hypothetical protein